MKIITVIANLNGLYIKHGDVDIKYIDCKDDELIKVIGGTNLDDIEIGMEIINEDE